MYFAREDKTEDPSFRGVITPIRGGQKGQKAQKSHILVNWGFQKASRIRISK